MNASVNAGGVDVPRPITRQIPVQALPPRAQPEPPPLAKPGLTDDPDWYRKAVFYEVIVRAFSDTEGAGTGDLRGIVDRLDYLQWLGVDCLWLPPFYPSPLRDGGYDVADFTAIASQYGTLQDFQQLIEAAHARGIRVVVDLVMNHTSDQHPWFQASRADPDGPYGDFYVWSDDSTRYQDARIIFVDTETSNWTFDPVRRQYFWHRFFSHQPDLNFENPKVAEAMLEVARFWLRIGVDGFRLDAVPYLFEEEGTNCENLPRTHEFLRRVRRMIDEEFPGRIMLAEANQWPQEVVEYFGTAEDPECHMCFHFPVMPRIYYALKDQRATQLLDILADTPDIPAPGGQWSTFLRNHDELTLEMVSTEERAAMYGWYAQDPRMRANVGIRRRLAPLLDNSRKEIELAHALLLSLPGSPCLYYGDEIGMGDNIWLPDRDAVRTPMQWTPDRNAGFSTADPGKLYLPLNQSLVHHYQHTNVEAQLAQPSSLLHWVHGMLAVRRLHPAFGTGEFAALAADDESVLAFTRTDGETLLVAANLSATARSATIEAPGLEGWSLTDLFGGGKFPPVGPDGRVSLSWGSRDFYWLVATPPDGGARTATDTEA
ncbi:maltose alpha-D-glucosyltransferase [Isoptericola halotolerans]|uniref:Alpha-amylase n=1 Tax=Isoptericola halotolerans TaxID=300560 RepID=A0ABX2A4V1_9MICO|nr:maltose alpha-D-glucosyltransferase [Isoptericola halotolerans]NOV97740.1 maltose alpha-D-glucosyltransferase/alpha-amylase [Isoptericola halotolerans]